MNNKKWINIQVKKMRGIKLSNDEKEFRLSMADLVLLKTEQIRLRKQSEN